MSRCRALIVSGLCGCVVAIALCVPLLFIYAQDKPPQLSADSRVTILKAQLKQKQIESQYLQIQQQLAGLQAQYTEATKTTQNAIDAAFKEAKVDEKEWNLNLDTLEFVKVPKPATTTKKP